MGGGGELIGRAGAYHQGNRLVVVLSDSDDRPHPIMKAKKYKFVEPVQCKHGSKKRTKSYILDEICAKCGESTTLDLRKQLRAVAMTDDEITKVSDLYLSYTTYEKSLDALVLPPLTDPIYRIPELPLSLREILKAVEVNQSI